jgi:hypothetical protein
MIWTGRVPKISTRRLASYCLATTTTLSVLQGGSAFFVTRHHHYSSAAENKMALHSSTSSGGTTDTLISAAEAVSSSNLLGGDFAGLSATFSPVDGKLIDIPSYLVPETLLEWGQEPKCLEVIVSEDIDTDSKEFSRSTITVYPAAGCSVDNMETSKSADTVDLQDGTSWYEAKEKIAGLQYATKSGFERIETIFETEESFRMRLMIDLKLVEDGSVDLKSPMTLVKERQTSDTSSGGKLADGGGLDGRTVANLLGEELRKSPTFAEEKVQPMSQSSVDLQVQAVALPSGISVSYGATSGERWSLQIAIQKDEESRKVITRKLISGSEKLEFEVSISD